MTKSQKTYGILFVIFAAIGLYCSSILSMPLTDDEIAAYGIPALKVNYNNFKTLLPWNYLPHDFFGHPPLNTAYFALVLRLFPAKPESLRIASLILSMAGLLAFFEIGKTLKSVRLGYILVIMSLSNFLFWENAGFIFSDNLFHTLFLYFVLAYFRNSRQWLLILGIAMVLTRETALIPFVSLWGMEAVKIKRNEENHFFAFSFLILAQLSWFLYLWIEAGSATPVYHNDGFFFEPMFILNTLRRIFSTHFIQNWWVVTFMAFFLVPVKNVLKNYWGFILIPLTLIFGLTTITNSISRYQMIGISSWIIFLAQLVFQNEQDYSPRVKYLLYLVVGILFIRNFTLGHDIREWASTYQQQSYSCAQKIKNQNIQGKVRIGGWPVYEIVTAYSSLQSLTWPPQKDRADYLYFDSQYSKSEDHDYFATFNLGQNGQNRAYFNNLKVRSDHELLPGTDKNSVCLIYRKLK